MKTKVPPVVVMLVFAVLMYALDAFLPVGEFNFFGRNTLSWILLGLAAIVGVLSVAQFLFKKTTVDPLMPEKANHLVTNGIYNFSRNPMYLALLLILLAFGLRLGNAFNTLLAAGFVYWMNHFQIIPEEEALKQKFGQEYNIYCKLTRRWF